MPAKQEIVGAARALLEEDGPEGLTMRRLAERLGIQAPSLYKHFPDKQEIEVSLAALGLEELGTALAGAADLRGLAGAYRRYALAHPELYRLALGSRLPRDRLPADLENRAAAAFLLAAGSLERARAVWAFAHGMVELELMGRFSPGADLDAAWQVGIEAFRAGADAPARAVVRSWRGPD